MRLSLVIFFTLIIQMVSNAQQLQVPQSILSSMDSLLLQAHHYWKQKNSIGIQSYITATDKLLEPIAGENPLFTGVMHLHQAYYATDEKSRKKYLDRGIELLKDSDHTLADEYSSQFNWLIASFYDDSRFEEWARVDTVFRFSVAGKKELSAFHYAITNYAEVKLGEKDYYLSRLLALYDQRYFENISSPTVYDKISTSYNKWQVLRGWLEQWQKIPYANRNNTNYSYKGSIVPKYLSDKPKYEELKKIDFKKQFISIFNDLQSLKKEMVQDNSRQSAGYNDGYRQSYYQFYTAVINEFYDWAVFDHKQSEAILPIKKFLFQDLIPFEMNDAWLGKKKAHVRTDNFIQLFSKLSSLYYAVGNAAEASNMIYRGKEYLFDEKNFTRNESLTAALIFAPHAIRAARLEGNLEQSLRSNQLMKKHASLPDTLSYKTLNDFEWYATARIEEVYTLLAQKKRNEAIDSMVLLLDLVSDIPHSSEDFIYSTKAWPNLQFLTVKINAEKGNWNTVLIDEMINDLLANKTHLDIFYPAQLLSLKASWRKDTLVATDMLANLLVYTERQLRNNFILLSAEERMRLYEQKLNDYFDVYHELLFSGSLDSFALLKEKVIGQSLYLKNALADGNILSDDIFTKGNQGIDIRLLNDLRKLRQQSKMALQTARLRNFETSAYIEMTDNLQSMWLNTLDGPGKDSLVSLPDWKKMAGLLNDDQVYIETVRYSRWLTDSAAMYAAYIITADKKIQLLTLCREDSLILLLKDPSSSSQTASLDAGNKRGTELLNAGDKYGKTFRMGDTDKLARLILSPLWKHISTKKELLIVQDGLLNRISFAALQWQQKYLLQNIQIRQLSGSFMLGATNMLMPLKTKALLVGGLDYGVTNDSVNINRMFKSGLSWNFLPGTQQEIKMLEPIFTRAGYQNNMLSGKAFPDTLRKSLEQYSFIHLATHGFYFDTRQAGQLYSTLLNKEAIQTEPLYRCGLALSDANNPSDDPQIETQGYLLGYELANTDLRNCYLVSLSACETGLGDVRNNLGVDGLSRALKIGGARHLLISLWKVPDVPTSIFMKQFYTYLFSSKPPAAALQATQLMMSKTYPASDWAAFILVE